MPKPKHPVWANFDCITKNKNTGNWARCKKCSKELQGIPSRMKKHIFICNSKEKSARATPSENSEIDPVNPDNPDDPNLSSDTQRNLETQPSTSSSSSTHLELRLLIV